MFNFLNDVPYSMILIEVLVFMLALGATRRITYSITVTAFAALFLGLLSGDYSSAIILTVTAIPFMAWELFHRKH